MSIPQKIRLLHKRQCLAGVATAAGTTDAVHVVVVGGGDVEVDHVSDADNVQASSSHGGGSEHLDGTRLEARQRALSLRLALVAVDRIALEATLHKHVRELLHTMLGLAEDEHLFELRFVEEVVKYVDLGHAMLDADNILVDIFCGLLCLHRNHHRFMQKFFDQAFDLLRQGRGEEKGVSRLWHTSHHPTHVSDETHVQHSVGLVEHHGVEFCEVDVFLFDEVLQSARSTDDKVVVVSERRDLSAHWGTSNTAYGIQLEALEEAVDLAFDLLRELAGGHHDEGLWVCLGLWLACKERFVDEWNEEGCGLAGTGVRNTHDVTSLQNIWNDAILNWGWELVSL